VSAEASAASAPIKFSKKKAKTVSPNVVADSIRILAFSDWRAQTISDIFRFVQSIQPVDFILYGGDDIGRFEEEERNYFSELSTYTRSKQVLAVIGNDDLYLQKRVLRAKAVHDLYDRSYVYKNFVFIGLEASTSGPAAFRHEEEDFKAHLKQQAKNLRDKRLAILSHAPPFGILDRGIRFAELDEFTHHIGSTALTHFIENNLVDLVVCGHCHSHGGMIEKVGSATIVNVSSHDSPGSKGIFAVIELTRDGTVDVEWHDTAELLERESLMRIHGIGPIYAEKLANCGVKTVTQLVECEDLAGLACASSFSEGHLRLLQLKAKSILRNEIYQIAPFEVDCGKVIFFDIETDIACKRVWLIGLQIDGQFIQFYADSWQQEKDILEEFAEILRNHPDYTLVSFSATNFDYRITFEAMHRHGMNTELLSSHPHIDICLRLRRSFIFPNQSFALKDLGSFLEYPFKYPDLNGFAVALEYHRHIEDGKPLDPKILEYNEDDVKVIPFLLSKVPSCAQKFANMLPSLRPRRANLKPTFDEQDVLKRSDSVKDYICPRCGHFHSSKLLRRLPPIQCYRCRYVFNE